MTPQRGMTQRVLNASPPGHATWEARRHGAALRFVGRALVLTASLWGGMAGAAQQPTTEQDAAQRTAQQTQRAQVLSRYEAERAACMHRFFVNDCLDSARKRERAALEPIDVHLQAIALRARMRAAEDELRRVQANIAAAQSGQPDRSEVERQNKARESALNQRQEQAAERARQATAGGSPSNAPRAAPIAPRLFPAPAPQSAVSPAQRAAAAAKAQAEYAAKQRAYEEKQAEKARQNAAQTQAAPLPVPSPSAPISPR